VEHQHLVRIWLFSSTAGEWSSGFNSLQDWYEKILKEVPRVLSKMQNWSAFWQFR
jgi:hypothetical protein